MTLAVSFANATAMPGYVLGTSPLRWGLCSTPRSYYPAGRRVQQGTPTEAGDTVRRTVRVDATTVRTHPGLRTVGAGRPLYVPTRGCVQ